ncbi:hypothetical protein KCU73_g2994, partial [Aureobasidium melanogenum]
LLLQQSSVIMPKRVKLSADISQQNVRQSHIITQEGRRSTRIANANAPRRKLHLLDLPVEVRAMIFEHFFTTMTEGETVKFDSYYYPNRWGWRGMTLLAKERLVVLPVFLICKQLSEEAQEVFWTTTTFSCKLWDDRDPEGADLSNVCNARQGPDATSRRSDPRKFHIHRIRHLEMTMRTKDCFKSHILQSFYLLAKTGHPRLQVSFSYYDNFSAEDPNPIHTIDSELANWNKIKAYQAMRKEAGLSVDLGLHGDWDPWQAYHLVRKTHWFDFDLPDIPNKNVTKSDSETSQQTASG